MLRHVSRRLKRLDVTAVEADVLKPLPVAGPFESAALHLVIHCLPGPMSRKAVAVAEVAAVLAPTGVLFGASVLGTSGSHTWLARSYLSFFNWQGGFDNLDDTEDGLREVLEASFEQVELEIVGSIAVFAAMTPRTSPLPQLPAVDDAHPDALVDRRRSGHVLGIDVDQDAPEPAGRKRSERSTEERSADPAAPMGSQDREPVDPATVVARACDEGPDGDVAVPRQQPERRVVARVARMLFSHRSIGSG